MALKGSVGGLPTRSAVEPFDHEHGFGITIVFSEKDFGFGEITFYVDKATGEVRLDNQGVPLERCGAIVERVTEVRRPGLLSDPSAAGASRE